MDERHDEADARTLLETMGGYSGFVGARSVQIDGSVRRFHSFIYGNMLQL